MLGERLDACTVLQQIALKHASLIGVDFKLPFLKAVYLVEVVRMRSQQHERNEDDVARSEVGLSTTNRSIATANTSQDDTHSAPP